MMIHYRFCLLFIAWIVTTCFPKDQQPLRPPNIVFIYADDLGWKDVAYNGNQFYETPAIDRLAREGMFFTNAYANAPFCSPSRASLMTGLYTPRHEVYIPGRIARGPASARKFLTPDNRQVLDTAFTTLAEVLKEMGYVNAHIGKWHLGAGKHGPLGQGFDVNVGGNRTGKPKSYFSPYKNPDIKETGKKEYLTDRLTTEAVKFIEDNKNTAFFLYLSHFAPHTPIEAKPEIIDKYSQKKRNTQQENPVYAAMIESLDHSVAAISKTLERLQLVENTIVIFYSDNGGYALYTSNKPLRGSKGTIYEGGIRVPLIVKWPGHIKAGSQSDVPVIGSDFFPTLLDMVDIESPPVSLDGESFWAVLKGERHNLHDRPVFWYAPVYLNSYDSTRYERDGLIDKITLNEMKRIRQDSAINSHPSTSYPAWRSKPVNAIRMGDYKLIEFFEREQLELYNLKDDLAESNNLATQMPQKVDQMYRILKEWRQSTGAPFPLPENPEALLNGKKSNE